jgi:hypothetical protein
MTLFLEIALANTVLILVLIAVHEAGHWLFGRWAGIPAERMRVRLLTFPQRVELRDDRGWVTVSEFDRYFKGLHRVVPSVGGQFLYVSGGFALETAFLVALTCVLCALGFWIYAMVAPGVSLSMYLVYVFAMDLPQSRRLNRPWGDTTILFSLCKTPAIAVVLLMVGVRLALVVGAWIACAPHRP